MKKAVSFWDCACDKCGHEWVTRSERVPKLCPGCKSFNWDESDEAKTADINIGDLADIDLEPMLAEINRVRGMK